MNYWFRLIIVIDRSFGKIIIQETKNVSNNDKKIMNYTIIHQLNLYLFTRCLFNKIISKIYSSITRS